MNIDGLSEETLDKFVGKGFIREYADIYRLNSHEDEIVAMVGFGRKSYDNLIASVDKSRHVPVFKLIYSLGIPNIGTANAKMICRHFGNDLDKIVNASMGLHIERSGLFRGKRFGKGRRTHTMGRGDMYPGQDSEEGVCDPG